MGTFDNLDTQAVPTTWTLEEALGVIRAIQQLSRAYNYHLCLGGGVLNKGESKKDLDLYFLPMTVNQAKPVELMGWLQSLWGDYKSLSSGDYPEAEPPYIRKAKFMYGELRIDVFVLGSSTDLEKLEKNGQEEDAPGGEELWFDGAAVDNVAGNWAGIQRAQEPFWRAEWPLAPPVPQVQPEQAAPIGQEVRAYNAEYWIPVPNQPYNWVRQYYINNRGGANPVPEPIPGPQAIPPDEEG